MYKGFRGMVRGYSLADFLAERRGVRNIQHLPRYSHARILEWADRHFQRRGNWPRHKSGRIRGAPGETWLAVDTALREGGRGLRGGSSLARLLADKRGVRNHGDLPRLSVRKILRWADQYRRRTGRWPKLTSGPIAGAPGETWSAVQRDLVVGCRGLPGGSSLAQLLAEHRGVRNRMQLPRLTLRQVVQWADEHHHRTGRWPTQFSGPIRGASGDTWAGINAALRDGRRGLPGSSSLAQLLAARRGVRNRASLPRLSERQILAWARDHRRRTGEWPKAASGVVTGVAGQTWMSVQMALQKGRRGLPGGSSLHRLLTKHGKPQARRW
jgi:hypothetical protein